MELNMTIENSAAALVFSGICEGATELQKVNLAAERQALFSGKKAPDCNGVYRLADGRFARFLNGLWRVPSADMQKAAMQTGTDAFASPQFRVKDHHWWFSAPVNAKASIAVTVRKNALAKSRDVRNQWRNACSQYQNGWGIVDAEQHRVAAFKGNDLVFFSVEGADLDNPVSMNDIEKSQALADAIAWTKIHNNL